VHNDGLVAMEFAGILVALSLPRKAGHLRPRDA
jgi:hypothetical protein